MTASTNIPQSLRENGLFCVWKREYKNGRMTKIPYNPSTGYRAKANDSSTFSPLEVAERAQSNYDGLGVGLFGDLCAIDIDHCISGDGSEISDIAKNIMSVMDTYTEISPSGKGLHILFYAPGFDFDKTRYYTNNRNLGVEVYIGNATNRFMTLTGNALALMDVKDRAGQLQNVLDEYMVREKTDGRVSGAALVTNPTGEYLTIEQIKAKDEKFEKLFDGKWQDAYGSQSEADIALCNRLAFWLRCDSARMDAYFRESGLMRDKWDRAQSGTTYGAITIQKAVDDCKQVYNPQDYYRKQDFSAVGGEWYSRLLELKPEDNARYSWDDIGNGYLFADVFQSVARYARDRKQWFVFNGKMWEPDKGASAVNERCKELATALGHYALNLPEGDKKDAYRKFVDRWSQRRNRDTILKDAQSVYSVTATDFDRDPDLLNCLNGTLDLKTYELRPHNPQDMLTQIARVAYDPDARCDRWDSFMHEVMQGDTEKVGFLQKAIGYSLTGGTQYECFFILYGATTRNGKSTMMETIMEMAGSYGATAQPETFAQGKIRNGSGPNEDIARLAGRRIVNASEPEKGMHLSSALIKTLTGNDTITARFLNENSFEFRPQFKLFMNTNYRPQISDPSVFSSGRVVVIPFERHFSESEQDRNLKSTLKKPENLSGVLNWCLEGLKMLNQEKVFTVPDSVKAAVDEYRRDCDKTARFIDSRMELDSHGEIPTSEAYAMYSAWCQLNGHKPEGLVNFKQSMIAHTGIEEKRKRPNGAGSSANPQRMFVGVKMKAV